MDCDNKIFITTPIKSVISPNYPGPYGNNLDCQLTLSYEDGVAIRIDILDIDKGGSFKKGCKYDWLEIHDGNGSDSKIIGSKICGSIQIRARPISHNQVTELKFCGCGILLELP